MLNVHLQPSGKPETIQPTIGLYFTDQPATKFPMLLQLQNDAKLDIPAGEKNFVVSDELTLPIDADLLAIYPHAHYLGKDLQAAATLARRQHDHFNSHSAVGFELAGCISIRAAGVSAQGNYGQHALRLRQFRRQCAES